MVDEKYLIFYDYIMKIINNKKLDNKLKNIAERNKIRDFYIFGSSALNIKHEGSDLDIGVIFKDGLPQTENRMKIYGEIFSLLSDTFSDEKVDLVFLEEMALHFQFKALTEGQLIYSANINEAFDYLERIINFYRDYKYFIDEFYKGVLEMTPI